MLQTLPICPPKAPVHEKELWFILDVTLLFPLSTHYIQVAKKKSCEFEGSVRATITSKVELDMARQLAKLVVDEIKAGFSTSSKDDLEAVKMITKEVGNMNILFP
ncbi:hypothetical protein Sjap_012290 [Stephania japonica]|uniref:Uncharacterized protein n=1 Tax=Stephania japonica TaxID=461633 RepID=A0AAP0IXG2_9MAGN